MTRYQAKRLASLRVETGSLKSMSTHSMDQNDLGSCLPLRGRDRKTQAVDEGMTELYVLIAGPPLGIIVCRKLSIFRYSKPI